MKFNLKIVAATAAVAMMSTAHAEPVTDADISMPGGTYIYSQEGLTLSGTGALVLEDIVVVFGNNLSAQDPFTVTLPGGVFSLDATVTPTLITCTTGGLPNSTAVTYVKTVSGGWQFRVAAVAGVSIGDTCTFSGLEVRSNSLANSNGTLVYRAFAFQTNDIVDSATGDTDIAIVSQYALTTVVELNGVINVYDDRLSFVDAETVPPGLGNFEDTLNFDVTTDADDTVFTGPVADTDSIVATIDGDFEWVDSDDNGTCEADEFDAAINYASWSADDDSTCDQLVWNGTAGNSVNLGVFEVPGDVILNPVNWIGNVTFNYSVGSATGSKDQSWDPGIWGINGAQVYIQYMPYGTNISRIIYAANSGLINADATADVYYDGVVYPCDVGAVNRLSVNLLSSAIDACVANTVGIDSGKVAILLTFTAPDKDIEVYSAYNVGGSDRGTVVNTSNGRTFFYGTGFPFVPPAN